MVKITTIQCSPADAEDMLRASAVSGGSSHRVRGGKMKTFQGLYDEMSSSLQFPYYFGENWAALRDCLSDLGWLPLGGAFTLLFTDAELLMASESDGDRTDFLNLLEDSFSDLEQDLREEGRSTQFQVVLQVLGDSPFEKLDIYTSSLYDAFHPAPDAR